MEKQKTFVYVLTTDNSNYLIEQCILSQYSLLLHNSNAKIITLVDDSTFDCIKDSYLKNFSTIIKVDCPEKYTLKEKSRYLKFKMRSVLDDDFLYIDSDTIITDDLSEVFNSDSAVAAVYDLHIPYCENVFLQSITEPKIKKAMLDFSPDEYFNGGVFYCRKDSKEYFETALKIWQAYETPDFCVDQVAFNYANIKLNNVIKPLNGIYNCQITENGLRYLKDAKIIHYFNTTNNSTFLLAHQSVLQKIRVTQSIPAEIQEMLKNAKCQFAEYSIILSEKNKIAVYNSKLFALCLTVYKRLPKIFYFLNKIISMLYK